MPGTNTSSNGGGGGSSASSNNGTKSRKRGGGGGGKNQNKTEKEYLEPKKRPKSPAASADNQSSTSSANTVVSAPAKAASVKNEKAAPKVKLLKRSEPVQPTKPSLPLVASVLPLMGMEINKKQQPPKQNNTWKKDSTTEPAPNFIGRQADANKKQRQEYYFSDKAGSAVSANKLQDPQYTMDNFVLERNTPILVNQKYNLLITPTTSRCNGIYIRVKSQNGDDSLATGALLKLDADKNQVRAACKEAMEDYNKVLSSNDRYPFSKSSESYLKACQIRRLDERQDAFPESIYYCEKCDYHINTISHAKAHLESSTHFDDIKRQEQRETLLKKVPKPTPAHLKSMNNVLREALDEYQEIRRKGVTNVDNILYYLKTHVFPVLGSDSVKIRPFGSSTYDVILPDSDYNIAYTMDRPDNTPIFSLLEKVRKKIADDGHPADHSMEMGTPSTIFFKYKGVRVRLCWMSCFNYRSQLYLSELLKTYVDLRKEVVEFLQLIRLWASKAEVDSKNKPRIGLPRYGFDIMAIHFLQKQGYLPVLHELFDEEEDAEKVDEHLTTDDNASEQSRVPPEEAGQRRIRLMSKYEKDLGKIRKKCDLKKPWNTAELFIKFFQYFVQNHRDHVIQITQKEEMSRDANRWSKKVLHVVDPFRGDNVLSIPKVSTWQPYYFNCLLTTYLSFAIPRTKNGPVVEISLIHSKTNNSKKKVKETPKRFADPPAANNPFNKITSITEEEYQMAADAIAEEEEHRLYMKHLKERLVFDGIKYNNRKPDDSHIDDHRQSVYSSRALLRFRRVLEPKLNEKIAIPLEELNLLKKKGKGWIKKWKKSQEYNSTVDENSEDEVTKVKKPVDDGIAKMLEEKLKFLDDMSVTGSSVAATDGGSIRSEISEISEDVKPSESSETMKNPKEDEYLTLDPFEDESLVVMTRVDTPSTPTSEETSRPPSATFVKPSSIPLIQRQICSEEFFIKENVAVNEIAQKSKSLKESDYCFEFNTESFCGNYELEMKCTHCDGSHCVENCPMMEIPPIKKFEARTASDLKDIDDLIDKYYRENSLDERRLKMMEGKRKELELFLKKHYRDDVTLTIFGSVMTGLGVNCSDIDICLRFGPGDKPPENLTAREVIVKTEEVLRKCPLAKKLTAITTAKVPIVKFEIKLSSGESMDADISYYNILAIDNTRLLKEYTLWTPDNRFAKLALFIKKWAKSCDIGDASRGSLSSYAHIILLITYLQNCDPPVLPRLQEDFRNDTDEKRLIDNWDTSFAQVESSMQTSWTKNKDTCAQLLIGYLDFYSRYDFRNFVVQCRREMILSKMEKDWPRPICVEDPFDLNHNLSSGVTKKMFVFIMKVFINSRAVFMSEGPPVAKSDDYNLTLYLHELLRKCHQGSAPTDRQCHNCHRIGHFVESCPLRQQKDGRRRFGSNSTNSSYRTQEAKTFENGAEKLTFHKRVGKTAHTRSYK